MIPHEKAILEKLKKKGSFFKIAADILEREIKEEEEREHGSR